MAAGTSVVPMEPHAWRGAPGGGSDLAGVQRGRLVVATFVLLVAGGLAAGAGRVLHLLFPVAAFGVAAVLYRVSPAHYVGLTWWLWFVTPGVRRLVDLQIGYNAQSPVILAPLLASGLAMTGVLRHLPALRRPSLFPFALLIAGAGLGYAVGAARAGIFSATYAVLSWVAPIAVGIHTALHWDRYPEYRRMLQRVFLWGVLVLGVYGIAQYVNPAPWDRFWMINAARSGGLNTVGVPVPFGVRVFSLLNSQLPFGIVMAAGLLLLPAIRHPLVLPAAVAGLVAFLLSLVRSAWLGWVVGALIYLVYLPWRARTRLAAAAVLLAAVGVATVAVAGTAIDLAPFVRTIEARFQTFGNIEGDVSYRDRAEFLTQIVDAVALNPLGEGLGATGGAVQLRAGGAGGGMRDFDNGVIDVFYSLGWFGGTLFMAGVVSLAVRALRRREPSDDLFAKAARAAALATLVLTASGPIFSGVGGAVMWTFFGMLAASHQWHASRHVSLPPDAVTQAARRPLRAPE